MGTVIGAIATGAVQPDATRATLHTWTSATSLLSGCLFVTACAYLAAVYLTGEAARRGDSTLQIYFCRRARGAAVVAGVLSAALLAELHRSDRRLYAHLTGRSAPLVAVTALCGIAVILGLNARRAAMGRAIAALGVAAVIWGWGVAQYPVLLPGTRLTLTDAGAPHTVYTALVVLFGFVVAIIGPALILLFALQERRALGSDP
jgi:cytochrome d ubiquinol oxidase subunit II